jgi:hypothetical protein
MSGISPPNCWDDHPQEGDNGGWALGSDDYDDDSAGRSRRGPPRCRQLTWTRQGENRRRQRRADRGKYVPVTASEDDEACDTGCPASDKDRFYIPSQVTKFVDNRRVKQRDDAGIRPREEPAGTMSDVIASYTSSDQVCLRGAMLVLLLEDSPQVAPQSDRHAVQLEQKNVSNRSTKESSVEDTKSETVDNSIVEEMSLAPPEETLHGSPPAGVSPRRTERRLSGRFLVQPIREQGEEEETPRRRRKVGVPNKKMALNSSSMESRAGP